MGFVNVIEACRQQGVTRFLLLPPVRFMAIRKVVFFLKTALQMPLSPCMQPPRRPMSSSPILFKTVWYADHWAAFFFGLWSMGPSRHGLLFVYQENSKGKPSVFNKGEMVRDFTYIDDIVAVFISSLTVWITFPAIGFITWEQPSSQNNGFHSGAGGGHRKSQDRIFAYAGGDVIFTCAAISAAQRDFGYNPKCSIETGLKYFVTWHLKYFKTEILLPNI